MRWKNMGGFCKEHRWFLGYMAVYFALNLLFLTDFPFVHSDEAWLSGLSRNMLEQQSLGVTERFFDLMPRNPHGIKTLFHLIQMPFLGLFGYRVFSFRLLSLLAALGCLWLCYRLGERLCGDRRFGAGAAVVLSWDVQFLYGGHFARQEIVILLAMLATALLLTGEGRRAYLWAGVVTGLSAGVHPNGFLVAGMGAGICAALWIDRRRVSWQGPLCYAGVAALLALFFVGFSLYLDPDFFRHYLAYGSQFDVAAPLGRKILETGPYFQRLYYQVSGTYYTPDIRLQLLLFSAALLAAMGVCLAGRAGRGRGEPLLFPLAAMAGIWAGMALVGRWSQPYVVFFFPFCYLAIVLLLARLKGRRGAILLAALCALVGVRSAMTVASALDSQWGAYDRYLAQIARAVPPDAKTIGNLNSEYHFAGGALLDYRNLTYLKEKGMTLKEYVEENQVEYLIVSDELALLYQLRPAWNGIYGNINYLDQLEALQEEWELVHRFPDNLYGVRVVRFQNGDRDFEVRIYRKPAPAPPSGHGEREPAESEASPDGF